jgi:tetratricopeptide (TPR) repeat protein
LSGRLDLLKGGRDADPRQQTLRSTIEWSHELLNPEDQRLFARLAVFRGGWTFEAAEAVTQADLDAMESLVDKSLVRHADDRFWMLETIHEYANERLVASGEADDVRRRHAELFLALAEEAEPRMRAEEQGEGGRRWIDRLERELDNSRAALDFLEAGSDPQLVVRMAGSLAALWTNNGHIAEGRRRIEDALRRLDRSPTAARAKALDAAAEMALFSNDHLTVRMRAEEARTIYRQLGDRWGLADATMSLGVALGEGGDWESARPLIEEGLELFRAVGDERREMWGTRTLAWTYAELDDLGRARPLYEDALRRARAAGNRLFESVVLGSLAWLALREGRLADCPVLLSESLRIKRELGDRIETATGLGHAAAALAAMGRGEVAASLIGSYEAMAEEIGGSEAWVRRMNDETLAVVAGSLEPGEIELALQKGRKLTADKATDLALDALNAN